MSAKKDNRLHLFGDILLAGFVGVLMQSWPAFFLTLAVLVGLDRYTGEVRLGKHRQTSQRTARSTSRSQRRRGMRTKRNPLPALAVGIVVVAALATVVAQDGWMLWPPARLHLQSRPASVPNWAAEKPRH